MVLMTLTLNSLRILRSTIILYFILTRYIDESYLPREWKTGRVVPLYKSGDAHNPSNYRPISITSIPCKILEHIIFTHLVNFLKSNQFFIISNEVLKKNASCETQLRLPMTCMHFLTPLL